MEEEEINGWYEAEKDRLTKEFSENLNKGNGEGLEKKFILGPTVRWVSKIIRRRNLIPDGNA